MKAISRLTVAAVTAVGLVLATGPAASQQPGGKKDVEYDFADLTVKAYQLKGLAETANLPEAAAGAYRLFLMLDNLSAGKLATLDDKVEVLGEDGKPLADAKVETKKNASYLSMADECLDLADSLAKAQGKGKEVTALLAAIKEKPFPDAGQRKAIGGPKMITRTIGGKQTHTYTIDFDTQTSGAIGFEADKPLRCKMQWREYVHFDQVVRHGSYSWQPDPKFAFPKKTYKITIHNHDAKPGTYRLFTN